MLDSAGHFRGGTRFKIFTQAPIANDKDWLEVVTVSSPAGSVQPGPADRFMYTVDPIGKPAPYGTPYTDGRRGRYFPPWNGPVRPGPISDAEGHFDYLEPGDDGFAAAHLFGATRFTLDVWEGYLGQRIVWHFNKRYEQLELSMLEGWKNGRMGFGFLEVGSWQKEDGDWHDYALNFDLIAHEVGHAILNSLTWSPQRRWTGEFDALHEMSADWVALITTLHFDSVVEQLLENTSGNLDTFNRLSRFAEFAPNRQVRIANNDRRMSDFKDGWEGEHDLALPLIGLFFDIFIDIYHEFLVDFGGVSQNLENLADQAEVDTSLAPLLQRGFDEAFARNPDAFKRALLAARDAAAHMLVEVWSQINPETFRFSQVPAWIANLDHRTHAGRFSGLLSSNFEYREILNVAPGPRIKGSTKRGHMSSPRLASPDED